LAFILIFSVCTKPSSKEVFETGESAGEYTPEAEISKVKEIERLNLNGYRFFLLEIEDQLVFGSNDSWVVIEPKKESDCISD